MSTGTNKERIIANTESITNATTRIKNLEVVSDTTATTSDILMSKTAYTTSGKITGTMPDNGTFTITPGDNAVSIPEGYTSGGTVAAVDITKLNDYVTCLSLAQEINGDKEE